MPRTRSADVKLDLAEQRTQAEVATVIGIAQQNVAMHERRAIRKIWRSQVSPARRTVLKAEP